MIGKPVDKDEGEPGSINLLLKRLYLVPIQKWLFSPISLLGENFNPRNIKHMPAVKIFARLELDENISFLDGHYLSLVLIPQAMLF